MHDGYAQSTASWLALACVLVAACTVSPVDPQTFGNEGPPPPSDDGGSGDDGDAPSDPTADDGASSSPSLDDDGSDTADAGGDDGSDTAAADDGDGSDTADGNDDGGSDDGQPPRPDAGVEPFCGDGTVDPEEECDSDVVDATCAELGFGGGTLACGDDCAFDTSGCSTCGDAVIGGDEDCDGDELGGAECWDAGYLGGGTIGCSACAFDTSGCNGPICGVADAGVGGCPAECTSCAGGVCTIDCPGDIINGGPCNGLTLTCPAGWPCHVACGEEGCYDTTIICADGVCTVDCDGINACDGAAVTCGIQQCAATCDIFSEPMMDCGGSCDCQAC